jgi:hypothetical protein
VFLSAERAGAEPVGAARFESSTLLASCAFGAFVIRRESLARITARLVVPSTAPLCSEPFGVCCGMLTPIGVSWIVATAFGTAVAAQLLLIGWLVRIYPTIPPKVSYGTTGKAYFWYAPRGVVWLAPASWLVILGVTGAAIIAGPPEVREQPLLAIPFFLTAVSTPVVALAIDEKINTTRRDGR